MTTTRRNGCESSSHTVPVYILAGGKSRRFGIDKARALCDGTPQIVGVARTLSAIADRITVVAARAGAYDDLGFRTIGDVVPRRGPLGGLLTAMDDCGAGGWIFVAACDWVGVRVEWAEELLRRRREGVQAILYRSDRLEPLFALYHSSVHDLARQCIQSDRLTMRDFLAEVAAEVLPAPVGWSEVVNLNRPNNRR